ncbi:TPA: hypothetical protein GF211_23675 [Escherichia coli]|nr:hypothetical protein [Escherichia coli]
MKKTLLALAVVTSAVVSGSAMAAGDWQDSTPAGDINFGGTVTVSNPVVWQWKVGVGKTDFTNNISQMNGQQDLTIIADKDMPIVAARLKNVVAGADFEQSGTFPKVSFTSNGQDIVPVYDTSGNSSMVLQVLDSQNKTNVLGTLTLNVRSAGAIAFVDVNNNYHTNAVWGQKGSILEGAVSSDVGQIISDGVGSAEVSSKFGAPTLDEIEQQVNAFLQTPGATFVNDNHPWSVRRGTSDTKAKAYAYSYGMGIESGKQLQLHFNNPVDQTTQWTAPLTVNIAYQ